MPRQFREFSVEDSEDIASSRGCAWWKRVKVGDASAAAVGHPDEPWWSRGWRKIREWSKKAVRPRWSGLLIRRFRQNRRGTGGMFGNRGQFRYDALSYKMNFDEGYDGHFDEERGSETRPDFGWRFASVTESFRQGKDDGTLLV